MNTIAEYRDVEKTQAQFYEVIKQQTKSRVQVFAELIEIELEERHPEFNKELRKKTSSEWATESFKQQGIL